MAGFFITAAVLVVALLIALVAVLVRAITRGRAEPPSESAIPGDRTWGPERLREGLIGWVGERINPIVLKELRQAVRSRFIISVLMLLLAVQVIVLLMFVMLDENLGRRGGEEVFIVLYSVLTGVSLLLVGAYAGVRLSSELSGQNVDLMFITTLQPRSIVMGKILSAALLALVMYSTCMPFMSFTYMLRGIDLPTIFTSLGFSFLCVLLAICVATMLGSIRGAVMTKLLMMLLFLGALIPLGFLCAVPLLLTRAGMTRVEYWAMLGSLAGLEVLVMGLFAVLGIAMVKPPVANRSMAVRIYLSAMWLLSGVLAAVWTIKTRDRDMIDVWASVWLMVLCVAMPIGISERDSLPMRIRVTIPRRRVLRWLTFPLFAGSAGGMVWCVLMAMLTVAGVQSVMGLGRAITGVATSGFVPSYYRNGWFGLDGASHAGAAAAYVFCASVIAGLLTRVIAPASRKFAWVGVLILVGLLSMLPVICYGSSYSSWGSLRLISPVFIVVDKVGPTDMIPVLIAALILSIVCFPLMLKQFFAFERPTAPPALPPEAADGGPADGGIAEAGTQQAGVIAAGVVAAGAPAAGSGAGDSAADQAGDSESSEPPTL